MLRGADATLQLAEFLSAVKENCLLDAIPPKSHRTSDLQSLCVVMC